MNRFAFLFIFCSCVQTVWSQQQQTYKFWQDIDKEINNDTVPWKHQIGASTYSFVLQYRKALETWDMYMGGAATITADDSVYFASFTPLSAQQYIVQRSANEQIIIINEAHHNPMHRVFTQSLLQGLYNHGYRYLALEALADTLVQQRGFVVYNSGFYTREPQFGNLVHKAIEIGFQVLGYDVTDGSNGREREIGQARNIARILQHDPQAKILVHCGFDHVVESDYKPWEKAMAGRLFEFTGINPFTIEQTKCTERSSRLLDNPFLKLTSYDYSVVMTDTSGNLFNGVKGSNQTDCRVIHPVTVYRHNRPLWLLNNNERVFCKAPLLKHHKGEYMILAYRSAKEYEQDGTPADIVQVSDNQKSAMLVLASGDYWLVYKDRDYKVLKTKKINVKK